MLDDIELSSHLWPTLLFILISHACYLGYRLDRAIYLSRIHARKYILSPIDLLKWHSLDI